MARFLISPSGQPVDVLSLVETADSQPTTIYVDQATRVPVGEQLGSVLAPFSTLTQAIAHINARPSVIAWDICVAFGDYRNEAALQLSANRRFVFEGIFRSSVVMRLPQIVWTVAGPGTSYLHFRNVEAGLVTVIDGSPTSSTTVLVYENSACLGINASSALAAITVLMSGTSLASYESSSNTFVLAVAREAAVNINNGTIFAQSVQFDATCPLVRATAVLADGCSFAQNMQIGGASVELRSCRWMAGAFLLTFMGAVGVALLDSHTQHSFDIGSVVLVNGSIRTTDQTYDTSAVIPLPEGSTTGQSTFGSAVTFAGASYRVPNFTSATHVYLQLTAVSAPTTIVLAFYQRPTGQSQAPLPRVGFATLLVSAPGMVLVPLAALMRLVPGVVFCLFGKVSGGGNVTFRTYTTPTQDLLNDPVNVPSIAYPTAFTTTIGVTTTPPATFDPRPAGGLVTPAGASNVTAIMRLATP